MTIVMRRDGSVSAMKPSDLKMATAIDGTELYQQAIARIRELEAEVEAMRPVIDAAIAWNHRHQMRKSDSLHAGDNLARAITVYESSRKPE